jgi:hypothetical protein
MKILVILLIIFVCVYSIERELFQEKSKIWVYWEGSKPQYIDLCFDTINKHCQKDFDIIILNDKSVHQYLPYLRQDINKLQIAQKTDYIRINLLYKYGGIWLDADTIVFKSLKPIINKLEKYDFVGFGCTGYICKNEGYPYPSNGILCSRKNGTLMKACLDKLNSVLDNSKKKFGYFELGKDLMYPVLQKLIKDGYQYYHYPTKYGGSRDKFNKYIDGYRLLSKNEIELYDDNKIMLLFLANSHFVHDDNKWFLKLDKNEILNGPYFISKMFRKSFS